MEFDEFFVKESPGLCRCCLSEGCYKDLGSEYPWMNETEVYADMLLECFDISITQHNEGPNGPNRLICEVCITRLRDACNFKKQVLESEKKFIDMLGRGEFKPKVLIYQTQMKKEQSEELPAEEVEYLDHEMDFDDGEVINSAETEEPPPVETVTAETLTLKRTLRTLKKGKVGRPKKQAVAEDKPRTSKAVAKGKKPNDKKSLSSTMRNRMMRENAVAIIESSTAVPFKWQQQDFLCFNCHLPFKDIKPLKEHARENHKSSSVKTAVSCLKMDDKVKIDVTDATCKHCDEDFRNLQSFVEHLKNVHDIKVSDKFGYGVVPYSFPADEVICGVCNDGFKYFINANKHMNQHFRDYVCEECGKAFMSYDRLRAHNLMHGAKFRCRFCTDTFESVVKRKVHEAKNHDRSGRVQCLQCSETFSNYNKRKKHLSLVHKVDIPMFNCTVCGKVYPCRSRMERHFRSVHVKERNVACTMCDSKFFSRADVRKHMKRHVGLTVHQCKICKKSYIRKQTLNDHMKTHFK